jgi:RNA polymerase sporulation-specific sigma factor
VFKIVINFFKRLFKKVNEIFYVGSSDILPEPLSKDDELKYLLLARDGDVGAKNKLIEHNLRLVVFLAKKFENTGVDLEDLVSIGTIGLIKGIKTYKIDKNIKLATYASRCVDNEILMHLRKNKKIRTEVSFEDSLSYDADGNELHLEDVLGTEPDLVIKELEDATEKYLLMNEINKLVDREKQIMILRYGLNNTEEMTQKDVANMLGISQSYISRIEKKIIRRLKMLVKI